MTREYWINYVEEDKKYPKRAIINDLFDHFEKKEANLRAEFQKKIAEINLEHDSRTCNECIYCSHAGVGTGCELNIMRPIEAKITFCCNKFKKKQQCTQKPNS